METTNDHPEWEKPNSLTCRNDSDANNKYRPNQDIHPTVSHLTTEEAEAAINELNITSYVDRFPRVDRTHSDPSPPGQTIGLISFVPSKGATPDKDGVYGFAKLRGNYGSNTEANERAEFLIRYVDSYHRVYHTYVGKPFPITLDPKYSAETNEIDIRKAATSAISSDIKTKKMEEQKDVNDIKDREQRLLDSSKEESEDPYESYITLQVKKAQLHWTYLEHIKKMAEVKEIILKTRKDIAAADAEYPDFAATYFKKYMDAREAAGVKENVGESQDNFIKFMIEDHPLPGIDDVEPVEELPPSGIIDEPVEEELLIL